MTDLSDRFAAAMARLAPPPRLGLAVSGGGDSMAMLHLAQEWAAQTGTHLEAATVDHGLRAESAAEAAQVQSWSAAIGIRHEILPWRGDKPRANLQAKARQARQHLLQEWAAQHRLPALMMAHTADDQAETVLMRLQRGSGVDGLAGMAEESILGTVRLLRPLLCFEREELRAWLRARGAAWIDDPSNEDERFERVAMRQAMATLGIAPKRIALAAEHMEAARAVLAQAAHDLAMAAVTERWNCLALNLDQITDAPQETRERLWAGAVKWLTQSPYRPRLDQLRHMIQSAQAGRIAQLSGVVALPDGNTIWLARDYAQLSLCKLDANGKWAGLAGLPPAPASGAERLEIRPAGAAGLAAHQDWRGVLPRRAALAEPMIFHGQEALGFVHAPHPSGVNFTTVNQRPSFARSLLKR